MVLTTSFVGHVLVMYCFVLGIAESKMCIEQQIMFLRDCNVVEWRRLLNGPHDFRISLQVCDV